MSVSTTTVTFQDERGHKAIATVSIDRAENTIGVKVAFEPAQDAKEKSDMLMLLNLLIAGLQGDDDMDITDMRMVNDDTDD